MKGKEVGCCREEERKGEKEVFGLLEVVMGSSCKQASEVQQLLSSA